MDAKCVQCAAKCCGNKLLDRSDLTFFTFPENDKLAKIWANNSNLENYCSESTLCSEHFEDIYFDNKYGKKAVFKENTEPIPTIFNLHKESQIPGRIDNLLLSRLLSNNDTQLDFGNIGSYTDHFIQPNTSSINVCNNDKVKSDTNSQPLCSNKISVDYIYCRLCAKLLPDCKLHPIYGASNYNELLEMCLPGKFLATDEISHKICSPCIRKLEFCSSILKSFIEADTKLRNLQTHISTKINEPTTSHQSDAISKPSDELIVQEREQIQFQCIKCSAIFDHKEDMVVHAFHSHPTLRGSKIISNIITNKIGKDHLNQLKPKKDVQTPRNTTKRFQCIICMDILDTKEAVISHTLTNHKQLARDKILTKIIDLDHEKLKNQCKLIVKHMCISCPTIYESKQEVIEHASLIHPQNKIVSKTILIKRNDSIKTSSLPLAKTQKVNQPTKKFSYYGTKFKNKTTSFPANVNKINKTNSRRLRPNTESSEYTFQIKYQCRDCSILFNSYKEVLDHFDVLHLTLKESGIIASVVKVRDSITTVSNDEQNSDNKENLVDCLKNDDNIVCVNDGTIIEVDPNAKPEGRKKKTKIVTEIRYKCLTCSKLFKHKKAMLQHSLLLHVKDVKPGLNEINCKAVKVKKEYNYRCYGKKERYECLICATHHLAKETLISHTRVFHPSISKEKFLCRFVTAKNIRSKDCLRCNTVIKNFNRYRLHIQKHVTFTCETCEMKFNKPGYLRNHLKIHQEPKIVETYKCLGCEEKFTSKIQKYIHEQIHKIPKVVSCSKCNKQFSSEFELKRHDKNYHAICLCDVCGKTYEVKYIRHHLETHNTNTPFKCKLCSRSFKTCGALSKHKKTHFPTNKNKTMCQICGKLFLHESIKLHMRIHTGERPEVCEICGAAFRRKDHLRNHKKTHMQDKIYQCLICHANLFSKQAYKTHMASTHDKFVVDSLIQSEKHFTCNICQKAFKQKINLEDHLRMHSGQRIYSCDICNKSFGTKLCVYQHKKTHLEYDQLPFKCEVCDKKFRRLENLRNHRRIHTGEKPFPCPICQRPFRVRGEMVKHMRIHKRTEERIKKKRSLEIVSVTDDSSQDVFSVQDSNSFEEFESSNMPSLE